MRTAPADAENDFAVQMSKLTTALLSDRYAIPQDILSMPSETIAKEAELEKYVVGPYMFKQLIGRGHREFSSGRQQVSRPRSTSTPELSQLNQDFQPNRMRPNIFNIF